MKLIPYLFAGMASLAAAALLPRSGAADMINGIAALVGKSVITFEQVQRFIARPIETMRVQYANQPDVFRQRVLEARKEGVERLIERRLIIQEFEDLKVNIPETYIEEHVQKEIKDHYDNRATLQKTLQEQGVTFESYRRDIREQFIEYIMRSRNVPRDILISPGRIEKYYRENEAKFSIADQVRLRMIVLEKTRNPVDATRLAQEVIAKLDEGVSFAEMATVYSDGSQAREGGLWGWVERKVLREDLADIAFQLTPGKRSEPIDKAEAVYIMLVEEARVAHVRPITEVREEIERTLVQAERNRLQNQWLTRLRKKAYVRLF